jgi:hypothetical protein
MMAHDYFAIQGKEIIMASSFIANSSGTASPTSVERAFSVARNYQANRPNLSPATIQSASLLKAWWRSDVLGFIPSWSRSPLTLRRAPERLERIYWVIWWTRLERKVIWWMHPDIGLMRARKTRWDTRYDKRLGM